VLGSVSGRGEGKRALSSAPPVALAVALALAGALGIAGCGLALDRDQVIPTFAIFDPSGGEIPMPNDVLRDEARGVLALDADDPTLTPADRELREWLGTRDGWSTVMPATVRFSGAIDDASLDDDTIQVWDWGSEPSRVIAPTLALDEGDRRLSILPPRTGWERGHTYLVVVRGGERGVRDVRGAGIGPDAIFYFLRATERLDTELHHRAFPGATRRERLANGARLEAIRGELAPFFRFFEDPARPAESEIPRQEIAALWSFTVTADPELAMDRGSQRVPLPFDLLIDPETGRVALEPAPWDSELELDAKAQLGELDGFALSANLFFETTAPIDPRSAPGRVHVFELGERTTRELPITTRVMGDDGESACASSPTPADCVHLVIEIDDANLPLRAATTYAVVVDRALRAAGGEEFRPMPIGHFVRAEHPLAIDGRSEVASLSDALASRLEGVRAELEGFLDGYGREHVVTAWPFTTMDPVPALRETARMPIDAGIDHAPAVRERSAPSRALEALFPGIEAAGIRALYLPRTVGVSEIVVGSLVSPSFLDPVTRRWTRHESGDIPLAPVRFYAAIPEGLDPSRPSPVVIFGHAVVTDARFLMTIAGELARRGFVAIAIDLPFHGERISCVEHGLVALPNFLPPAARALTGLEDDILRLPPCASGQSARCTADGRCLTASGAPDELAALPLVSIEVASGAAFLDVHDLPHIPDHFRQALVDLSSLLHAVRTGELGAALGIALDPETIHYVGQSLGAIVGAVWVAVTPEIDRTVLNVVGADMVDLFAESTYFQPQIEEYFASIPVRSPSFERERLLDVARWLVDAVDPHSVGHLYALDERPALIQMGRGDIVIPNRTTEVLERVSGLPVRSYPSPLHADLVVPGIGDAMLRDAAAFLAGAIDR
jgi:hypothetical protein